MIVTSAVHATYGRFRLAPSLMEAWETRYILFRPQEASPSASYEQSITGEHHKGSCYKSQPLNTFNPRKTSPRSVKSHIRSNSSGDIPHPKKRCLWLSSNGSGIPVKEINSKMDNCCITNYSCVVIMDILEVQTRDDILLLNCVRKENRTDNNLLVNDMKSRFDSHLLPFCPLRLSPETHVKYFQRWKRLFTRINGELDHDVSSAVDVTDYRFPCAWSVTVQKQYTTPTHRRHFRERLRHSFNHSGSIPGNEI